MMKQSERVQRLIALLKDAHWDSHEAILAALEKSGISSTQATLSRDLARLGVQKVHGTYQLPYQNSKLQICPAGPNLLVLKTMPGRASAIAAEIDSMMIPGLVGTIAGDDTVFIAVENLTAQNHIQKHLLEKLL